MSRIDEDDPDEHEVSQPAGLAAWRLEAGSDEFAILEWPADVGSPPVTLGRAERDVLALVLDGLSNAEIAARRSRSVRTVANQVASVFQKVGVSSRSELFAAMRRGRR